MSVEMCSGLFSSLFLPCLWYDRSKSGREGGIAMLGARIAALRRERGMSQSELAERLQVSPSAMGMYEQGRREPSAQMLVALARELEVSTDFLLTGQARTQPEADALSQMLLSRITTADRRMENRPDRPFSRQEIAVLFAALLMEP